MTPTYTPANGQQLWWEMAHNDCGFCINVSMSVMLLAASCTLLGLIVDTSFTSVAVYSFLYATLITLIQVGAAALCLDEKS